LLRLTGIPERVKIILEKTLQSLASSEPYALKLLDVSDGMYYLQIVSSGKVNTT